jgi:hypothetical protein
MKIKVIVEKTKTGYSAYAEKYAVFTTGKDLNDLKLKMLEALNLYFEDSQKPIELSNLHIHIDLPQFFNFYNVINAKAFSERIGMHQTLLAQYIHGNKKPSPKQTERMLKGVQELGRELAGIRF